MKKVFYQRWKYEGEWKNGKQHGKGKETFATGREYDGEYEYGMQHGKGIGKYINGEKRFVGEYMNGKQWKGTSYDRHGNKNWYWDHGQPFRDFIYKPTKLK